VLIIGLDCNRLMRVIGRKIKEMVQELILGSNKKKFIYWNFNFIKIFIIKTNLETEINTSEDGKMIQ
jgi:hypothetical protein